MLKISYIIIYSITDLIYNKKIKFSFKNIFSCSGYSFWREVLARMVRQWRRTCKRGCAAWTERAGWPANEEAR